MTWWYVYLPRRLFFPIYSFALTAAFRNMVLFWKMSCLLCTHTDTHKMLWMHNRKDLFRRCTRFRYKGKENRRQRRHDCTAWWKAALEGSGHSRGYDSLGKGCAESIRRWLNYLQCVTESCPLTIVGSVNNWK